MYAERDNEVDWEQLALSHIDETPTNDDDPTSTPPAFDRDVDSPPEIRQAVDTPQPPRKIEGVISSNAEQASDKPYSAILDDGVTDTESVFSLLPCATAQVPLCPRLLTLMLTCYAAHAAAPCLSEGDGDHFESVFFSAFQEPVSYASAMRSPDAEQWIAAINEEKEAFFANGTWEIVDADPAWNLLSSKWVFKLKRNEHGNVTRYRARLVARGFLHREGMDFGDIFSPVVRYSTLRIILALAAQYSLFKRHLDCPKAFTQADLDTVCYMKPPPGMKLPKGKCIKLHKSVYGLKQASRLFNQLLVSYLVSIGFVACPSDTCLMYLLRGSDIVLMAIYVDALLLCASCECIAAEVTNQLADKFRCVDMGEIA